MEIPLFNQYKPEVHVLVHFQFQIQFKVQQVGVFSQACNLHSS